MKRIAVKTRFLIRNVLVVVLLQTPKVPPPPFFFFFFFCSTEMSCVKPLSGPVEPSARMQVDFVGATPFRENQMEMPTGPPAWRRGTDGARVAGRLRGAGHGQFLQVVHEDLQADVVGEDGGPRLLEPPHKQQGVNNMSGTVQEHATAKRLTGHGMFLTPGGAKGVVNPGERVMGRQLK